MEPRDKRDLPEVIAEILIEQHAMREDIAGMRQDINGLRQEMREEIGGLRLEIKEEIGGLRLEMKEEIGGLRLEVRTGLAEMAQTFNNMTNAILDAMNRGNDRYERTGQEIDSLKTRVSKLENPASNAG
jgi:predicted  nucleic acid-binding Zn-ribbon protein